MNDHDYPELDDKQIELAKSFNAVAQKFVDILLNHDQLIEWNNLWSEGQPNSYIAEKAAQALPDDIYNDTSCRLGFLNAIKTGGLNFTQAMIETAKGSPNRQAIAAECKTSIIRSLFMESCFGFNLPDSGRLPTKAHLHPAIGYKIEMLPGQGI